MAAFVCLQPSPTSLDVRSSKVSLIVLLVAAEIPMCSPYILAKLYESMGSGLHGPAVGGAPASEGAALVKRTVNVGTPQKACASHTVAQLSGPFGNSPM